MVDVRADETLATGIPAAPERTADDAPSTLTTVRLFATPALLLLLAIACFVKSWIIAGVILSILTVACIAIEVVIGWLFIKFSLRDHANMFKTLAPLLAGDAPAKRKAPVAEALSAEEERLEAKIDQAVGFGLTRMAAAGGIGGSDLDDAELAVLRANVLEERALTYGWLQGAGTFERVSIEARDGASLVAQRLVCRPDSGAWAILCHGYAGTWGSMLQYARHFAEQGCNLLIVHMRGHGESGGRYIGMGCLDRRDVVDWASWLVGEGSGPAPCTSIVLMGHSMGAASVCLAAGEPDLPGAVRAVVADCGFDTTWHAIANKIKGAGLPVHPTADLVRLNLMARRGGYDLAAGDVTAALGRTQLPIIVLHGLKDSMVPAYMAGELYRAATGEKRLVAIPGAGHCQSSLVDPVRYWGEVFGFIGRFM